MTDNRIDARTRVFEVHRPRLVRLAYRMLGSLTEAEDIVQDAWLRWRGSGDGIENPEAYLSRIVSRLCLDLMKSARARHEVHVGVWLPEPLVETYEETRADDVTLTLMLALERLSPLERAAFLLHDVFDMETNDIAASLERSPAAVRQLAARARKNIRAEKSRFPVSREEGDRLVQAFFTAAKSGDIASLKTILADDGVIRSDGGGRVHAFLNPIVGIDRVLRLYAALARKRAGEDFVMLQPMWIDGLPGFATYERGGLLQTTALEIEDGRVTAIYITRDPEKLTSVRNLLSIAE